MAAALPASGKTKPIADSSFSSDSAPARELPTSNPIPCWRPNPALRPILPSCAFRHADARTNDAPNPQSRRYSAGHLRPAIYKPRPCLTRSHSNPAFHDSNHDEPESLRVGSASRTEAVQSNEQSPTAQVISCRRPGAMVFTSAGGP